jgi:23S rRNA maturation mini-RNase III
MRDDQMRTLKESLQSQINAREQDIVKRHKNSLDEEIRKHKRRKLIQFQQLEQNQLREV